MTSLLSAGLLMGFAGAADAADLVTSSVNCSGRIFSCIAHNISNKTLNIMTETANGQGSATIVPGATSASGGTCSGLEFCRFKGASKRDLRGSYCVSATALGPCELVGDAR
jgi:hypothetical protein